MGEEEDILEGSHLRDERTERAPHREDCPFAQLIAEELNDELMRVGFRGVGLQNKVSRVELPAAE